MTTDSIIGDVISAVTDFVRDNSTLVEVIVFALGFAESIVLVSIFVPSTALFLAIGAAHSAAGGDFVTIWLAGSAGATLGDVLSFAIGRHFREGIRDVWPFTSYPELFPRCRIMFRRWGMLAIIAGKFMGNARPFLPVVAGAMTMRWPTFAIASVVSSLLWAGVFLSPGYGVALFYQ